MRRSSAVARVAESRCESPPATSMAQQGVEATDRPGAERDQVVAPVGEQAQHRGVIPRPDDAQCRVPQRDDRGGAGVVRRRSCRCAACRGAGLGPTAPVEHRARSHRPRRVVGPAAPPVPVAPSIAQHRAVRTAQRTRTVDLVATIRVDAELAHELLVTVEHRGGVGPLVRVDTDDEHEPPRRLSDGNATAGSPEEGVPFLFRATPQREPVGGLIARKPTEPAAGHSRDHPPDPRTVRAPTRARITVSFRAIGAVPGSQRGSCWRTTTSTRMKRPFDCSAYRMRVCCASTMRSRSTR